ncbi:DUF421 domain-containing protein [Bacillus sp. SCS-153A]|uniref:DUF421 domain-containing protein n=1 Tax=Rossellomorea sedimentorum TaxID=3115294 RepID=UPI003905BE89
MFDTLLFDGWRNLIRAVIMCLLAYPFLLFLLRLFGRRTLAHVNMFDFIITITYGAILSTILTNDKVTLAEGAVILFMLTLLQLLIAKLTVKSKRVTDLIKASPSYIFYEGQFYKKEMGKHRILIEDLRMKIRNEGLSSFERVEAIVLEGDGSISIIKKEEVRSKDALIGVQNHTKQN